MDDLLLHSMSAFASLIVPSLGDAGVRDIAEIGAEYGGMSAHLAEYCQQRGGTLTSIDPSPRGEFLDWVKANPHVRHLAKPSLQAIAHLGAIDAWLIDGDHNYYTVSHELALIDESAKVHDRPLLVFLHDVGWPCARRDQYYAPENIPFNHRHPFDFDAGITLGHSGFTLHHGFRGAGHWAPALEGGGARNGVLTAVEDFLALANNEFRPLTYFHVPAVFGLGVIYASDAPWADTLAARFAPWHENILLATMEVNRLRNYLAVIDWQDRQREHP